MYYFLKFRFIHSSLYIIWYICLSNYYECKVFLILVKSYINCILFIKSCFLQFFFIFLSFLFIRLILYHNFSISFLIVSFHMYCPPKHYTYFDLSNSRKLAINYISCHSSLGFVFAVERKLHIELFRYK